MDHFYPVIKRLIYLFMYVIKDLLKITSLKIYDAYIRKGYPYKNGYIYLNIDFFFFFFN